MHWESVCPLLVPLIFAEKRTLELEQVLGSMPVRLKGLEADWSGAATAWGQGDKSDGSKGGVGIAELYGDAPLVSRWSEGSYLFGLLVRPTSMAQVRPVPHFTGSTRYRFSGLLH